MFNKGGFDTSFYDRASVIRTSLEAFIDGTSGFSINLQSLHNLSGVLSGSSNLNAELTAKTEIQSGLFAQGSGSFTLIHLVYFFLPLDITVGGNSSLGMSVNVGTQLEISFEGSGDLISNEDRIIQTINTDIRSNGSLAGSLNLLTFFQEIKIVSEGSVFTQQVVLKLPLEHTQVMSGLGNLKLRRIGEIDKDVFELEGINLLPGQTVKIDTDLLMVWINGISDVSSVTPDSTFFELLPGITTFTIDNNPGEPIEVDVIWQNRWL